MPSIQISVAQHRREMELRRNLTQILHRSSTARPTPAQKTTTTRSRTRTTTEPSDLDRDADLLRTHVIKTSSEIIVASSSDSVTIIDHLRVGPKETKMETVAPPGEDYQSEQGIYYIDDDDDYSEESSYDDDLITTPDTITQAAPITTTTTPSTTTTETTTATEPTTTTGRPTSDDEVAELYPNQFVGRDLTTRGPFTDSITRVFGRYMSVDNDKLIQMDQHLRRKHQKYAKSPKKTPRGSSLGPVTKAPRRVEHDSPEMLIDQPQDLLTTKELLDDMERIMKNGNDIRAGQRRTKNFRRGRGACFTGADSYFHYNDAETMRRVISYQIDLNLRFKTHSVNGLILWTGRHTALEEDDYLSLGIENG